MITKLSLRSVMLHCNAGDNQKEVILVRKKFLIRGWWSDDKRIEFI